MGKQIIKKQDSELKKKKVIKKKNQMEIESISKNRIRKKNSQQLVKFEPITLKKFHNEFKSSLKQEAKTKTEKKKERKLRRIVFFFIQQLKKLPFLQITPQYQQEIDLLNMKKIQEDLDQLQSDQKIQNEQLEKIKWRGVSSKQKDKIEQIIKIEILNPNEYNKFYKSRLSRIILWMLSRLI